MSYNRRGELEMKQQRYKEAEADFDMAIRCDSDCLLSYFNRAIVYSSTNRPMQSLADFDRVLLARLDQFAHLLQPRHRPLADRRLQPCAGRLRQSGLLLAGKRARLLQPRGHTSPAGNIESAVEDYSKAIELYPDFANAYLNRSRLRAICSKTRAVRAATATSHKRKIAEYKTRLSDSTYSRSTPTRRTASTVCRSMPTSPAAPSDASPPRAPTTALRCCRSSASLRTPDSLSTVTAGRYHSQRGPISAAASTTGT